MTECVSFVDPAFRMSIGSLMLASAGMGMIISEKMLAGGLLMMFGIVTAMVLIL